MFKKKLSKKAACIGLTATLVAGFTVTFVTPTAATLCRELNLAGISPSLDKYSAQNQDKIISSSVVTQESISAPATTAAATATPAPKKKEKKKTKKPKRTDLGLRTDMSAKAISTARDYVNVRAHASKSSRVMGKLYKGCAADVLKKKGSWVKIKSGNVTGYIKKDYLAIGSKAKKLTGKYGQKYVRVKQSVVTLNVREKQSTKSDILTQIPVEENYDVIKETKGWYKILIDGDTKGFVKKEYVTLHVRFKHAISIKEERAARRRKLRAKRAEARRLAALAAQRRTSRAAASSNSSSSSGSSSGSSSSSSGSSGSSAKASGSTGSDIARYALNFVGNPYRWGGTSLTNGADCSGFVMSIYAQYGYSLPHSSASQSGCGTSVSLSSVQPGDLIFYKHGSSIGHVAMYIGGGRIVHAASTRTGIITSNMYYNQPACARRIV